MIITTTETAWSIFEYTSVPMLNSYDQIALLKLNGWKLSHNDVAVDGTAFWVLERKTSKDTGAAK